MISSDFIFLGLGILFGIVLTLNHKAYKEQQTFAEVDEKVRNDLTYYKNLSESLRSDLTHAKTRIKALQDGNSTQRH
jgi:hypothetical protein